MKDLAYKKNAHRKLVRRHDRELLLLENCITEMRGNVEKILTNQREYDPDAQDWIFLLILREKLLGCAGLIRCERLVYASMPDMNFKKEVRKCDIQKVLGSDIYAAGLLDYMQTLSRTCVLWEIKDSRFETLRESTGEILKKLMPLYRQRLDETNRFLAEMGQRAKVLDSDRAHDNESDALINQMMKMQADIGEILNNDSDHYIDPNDMGKLSICLDRLAVSSAFLRWERFIFDRIPTMGFENVTRLLDFQMALSIQIYKQVFLNSAEDVVCMNQEWKFKDRSYSDLQKDIEGIMNKVISFYSTRLIEINRYLTEDQQS